jgi:hypothetical protein
MYSRVSSQEPCRICFIPAISWLWLSDGSLSWRIKSLRWCPSCVLAAKLERRSTGNPKVRLTLRLKSIKFGSWINHKSYQCWWTY